MSKCHEEHGRGCCHFISAICICDVMNTAVYDVWQNYPTLHEPFLFCSSLVKEQTNMAAPSPVPNKPHGFCGCNATLNHLHPEELKFEAK